ncbi:hypothetical protein PV332_10710 [Streptomyces scabiei]|uniref:hypothetical protein n=1 Tax=Streptomyces scabiei TaxID=1930 RepID=UPI0029A7FB61|nr:hypothetical protein [Streptomyces scabiei]MDX2575950.1 hypothetical protein [Streptomyces scabiei]MDX2794057.1 hypothetical protein [Streptomyces scabiei]MDX2885577.1 hypothetical protein [Streptomyces scabiei]MDX2993470.1 hypothetical protein [Streptomyces scabiei]MDX3028416.1 hypothetical protein [Streptomyces scabiei]
MEQSTHTELTVAARDIRRGDVFTLHGRERTAFAPAWPTVRDHVHLMFEGGGDAVIPADREFIVRRPELRACGTE